MALYKRGSVWWMSFIFNGHRIQKSTKSKNKRDAAEIERAFRTQLAKGQVGIEAKPQAPVFSEAMKIYLDWSGENHTEKPSTHARNKVASRPLLKYFGDVPIDRIEKEDVENYRNWRRRQKRNNPINKKGNERILKPSTVNRELATLRSLFKLFVEKKKIAANPVKGVKFLSEDNLQMRVLSESEERIYLMAARQPLRDVAIIMLETGMRPEEVCRIESDNFCIEKRYLFNPYGKTKAARRGIPLSDRALAVLENRLENVEGKFLFPPPPRAKHGLPHVLRVNTQHRHTIQKTGIEKCRLYDLRHTFATRAVEAGVDLVTLAALLGHANLKMVMRYAHPSDQHKFDAIMKMQKKRELIAKVV